MAITVEKVVNGEFSFSVTVPSETMSAGSFENYRPARINLYACDYNNFTEAMGSNDKFYIYGYDETVKSDENGPEIKTFGLNSENFTSGGVVNESPLMIACIADPDGINFSTAGLGHKITLTLDETVVYNDLINYYQPMYPDGENASMGQIYYPLSNIPMGTHTLKLKVWDIFNNSSTKEITFTVKPGEKPEIYDLYTNSNPARESAEFYLTHNRPDAVITMTVEVFDLLGKEVWSHTQTGRSDLFTTLPVVWDLCDGGGRRVTRGIYVYRATISCEGSRTATKSKRIDVAAP